MTYPFAEIESKWQSYWEKNRVFEVHEDPAKKKLYVLDMFPYPSGAGLHVGHPEGYTATDIYCRYKRMKGFNVLHTMGWDAFGLPAERYAMQTGIHPRITTQQNIDNFRRQIKMLGLSYDWSREVNTTDPAYYRWTQWIFLQIFDSWYDRELQKARPISELPVPRGLTEREAYEYVSGKRLAYLAESPVNWCGELGTVLANEEVDEWVEKGYTVERRMMRQWMLRITAYAERLAEDLNLVDWPPGIVEMQKNWIGKSVGAEISFKISGHDATIRVFTTRPDTLFGATYMVLAPEHRLVEGLTTREQSTDVKDYINRTILKSDLDRSALDKEKSGVFTGSYAVNPATGNQIPIWIADYVLVSYGTGAIMAVPGHDERDHEFARKYGLTILEVVRGSESTSTAYTGDGIGVNSSNSEVSLNGLTTPEAKSVIIRWLEANGIGHGAVSYKLRDWLFSRQRYWGEPFPIIYLNDGTIKALTYKDLPVLLPIVDSYQSSGTGESALATASQWLNISEAESGKPARRETHTMPQWAGSCWYYLRYIDPGNREQFVSGDKERYWMPVDLYVGGAEHAVLHLLYARFWHKVLFDLGFVSTKEPFSKLINQGTILGEDGRKMSKSLGNVVNPDNVVNEFGADSLRLFEMFMGPLVDTKPWATRGVEGVHRFLNRVWRMIVSEDGSVLPSIVDGPLKPEHEKILHNTIKKVTRDIENLDFNTAISQMMIFVNEFLNLDSKPRHAIETFVLLLSPFAPHLAEELWQKLGHGLTIAYEPWPAFDDAKIRESMTEIVVQVNGKVRAKFNVPLDSAESELERLAFQDAAVGRHIEGKSIRKVLVVRNNLVSIVAS